MPDPDRQDHAAAIGRLGAALLAGRDDVPTVDPQTDARVRVVIGRLQQARADLEARR